MTSDTNPDTTPGDGSGDEAATGAPDADAAHGEGTVIVEGELSDREPAERHDAHTVASAEHGWPDAKYIQLAVALAIITGLEVYASYADWLGAAFIPALMIMMIVKFAAVVLFFMHLKFDSPIFGWLFYSGLFLAISVYVGAMLTFQFFGS